MSGRYGLPEGYPQPQPASAQSPILVGYGSAVATSSPSSQTQAVATFGDVPLGQAWLIDRATVQIPTADPCKFFLFESEQRISSILDYASEGRFNIFEGIQPLYVGAGSRLVALWTHLTVNDLIGTCRIQYRILKTG